MRVSAKTDYALRALIELANRPDEVVSSEVLAQAQDVPVKFLEAILVELRRFGFIASQRGYSGGHRLKLPAEQIVIADVIRAVNGPLTTVRGECPEDVEYVGAATRLQLVWVATRQALRQVLEQVTLADIVGDTLPSTVLELSNDPDAWVTHWFPAQPAPAVR